MRADKLRAWLERAMRRPTCVQIRASAERLGNSAAAIQTWEKEELGQLSDPAQALLDACEDYANEKCEAVACVFEVLDSTGTVVTQTPHRALPTAADDLTDAQKNADKSSSANAIVQHLLNHDTAKERILIGSLGSIFAASNSAIQAHAAITQTLLARMTQLETENSLLRQQLQAARSGGSDEADTEEARAAEIAKQEAWQRFSQLAPLFAELALAKWGGGVPPQNGGTQQ